jgi:pimeloyl-ACP methyl ester carboxylesterase
MSPCARSRTRASASFDARLEKLVFGTHRLIAAPQPTLVFGHANGFPASTYSRLFELWRQAGWKVVAPEKLGHNPAYPVTTNWPHLRTELLQVIEAHTTTGPVTLVGHSLGGFLSVLAASRRPEWVSAVVLLDAPVLVGWRARTIQAAKLTRLMQRLGPGHIAARRREHWPSREAALAHFVAKKAFAAWHPSVLADYIQHGTLEVTNGNGGAGGGAKDGANAGGVRLAFDRRIETQIYNSLPHQMQGLLRRHPLRCPVAFIGGTRSVEVKQVGLSATHKLAGPAMQWVEGSHLFPMERPDETAAAVVRALGGAAAG